MNKRSNRVYIVLVLMLLVMFGAMYKDARKEESFVDNSPVADDANVETTTEQTTESAVAILSKQYTDEQKTAVLNEFCGESVVIGDSIAAGYSTYAAGKSSPDFIKKLIFLASVSYGTKEALSEDGDSEVNPVYQGESRPLTESLGMIKPHNIFIDLGINELDGVSAEKVGERYGQLIERIIEVCPDSRIFAISLTYIVDGKEKENFTNNGIRAFNSYISSNSEEWGITYLDLASRMADDKGCLKAEYSSDGYVHYNVAGFKVCDSFFEEVALRYYDGDIGKRDDTQTATEAETIENGNN